MSSVDEVFRQMQAEQNEIQLISENETIVIDAEQRTIVIPESESLFGVKFDKDVERKYFQCPKIVGDNIDLSQCQIYIAYVAMTSQNQQYPETGVGLYNCDDVEISGDNITFSWKLSGNVFTQEGYIAFKVVAKQSIGGELSTRWNTVPAFGTILNTISDGEDIAEQYPDVINQILDRLDELEQGGEVGGTSDYNDLFNKPKINNVEVAGDKTASDYGLANENDVHDIPSGGTAGQMLSKKTNTDYDVEWTDAPVGGDTYFELVNNNTSVTNGVSLDISGLLANAPSYGEWDDLQNWYRMSYRGDSIPALNGFPAEKIISKPIQGIPYFRAFTDQSNQYSLNNAVGFYGSDSDKAITEEGHEVKACSKTYEYIPVDNLPDDTQGAGVIIVYPTESYDYYYIKINDVFFANNNTGKYNRTNPTYIAAFDSGVLENPLMSIAEYNEQYLKMKDEYLDGYYKNMFVYEPFVTIFKNYFAQMAPKVGIPQTFGKAIYIGGDSLHAYAGGDGKSTDGFVTNWNQYLGFSVVTNAGYAGSTWSELTGGGGLKRAKDLISAGTVYDVIILAWGTNDDTGGNGTIDDVASDAEGATMVAAMKWIITNLRNTFKNTSIGVIIPPPKNTEDGMKTKGDLMVQVCELLHVPFVDMRQYVSISDLGSDTVHLGTGAGKYGAVEASLILRICQYGDTLYPDNSEIT